MRSAPRCQVAAGNRPAGSNCKSSVLTPQLRGAGCLWARRRRRSLRAGTAAKASVGAKSKESDRHTLFATFVCWCLHAVLICWASRKPVPDVLPLGPHRQICLAHNPNMHDKNMLLLVKLPAAHWLHSRRRLDGQTLERATDTERFRFPAPPPRESGAAAPVTYTTI